MKVVSGDVWGLAISATIIPLSVITSMIHQRFKKHRFFESTLELLQKFYPQMESNPEEYRIFPGDLSKYSLKCVRCGKCINPFESIGTILFIVPMAILHHLNIMSSVAVNLESDSIF
jgi:hypothetical protein